MAGKFTLKVITHFASAHTLRGYPGACARMHGHNWRLETVVEATELNDIGMAIDFKLVKSTAKTLSDQLDHYYLNDIPPFNDINPTAENIAWWFYQELSKVLNNNRVRVKSTTIWETESACASYSEDV